MQMPDLILHVKLEPAPEGGFTVTIAELPECMTEGDTLEAAVANAREAMELCLEERRARGMLAGGEPQLKNVDMAFGI